MPVHLTNELMHDGSRLFFTWPQNCSPLRLLWLIVRLPALPTTYLPDLVTGETWIDWRWRGHRFSAHSIYGDFLFFPKTRIALKRCCARWRNILPRRYLQIFRRSNQADKWRR